ncbi:hypothetical protein A6E01_18995 (plasmid) [Vibrio breoganii]|uniref:Uncharacterized protein n=1 Tax=Vibrio breoganii TaxID=553239 RepID=A0AAN1CU89_9VIBR|nr:hypothetical protein [Vibrio breoganii]ANO35302.1 hypothetical protein A6E01_18995 [Vibrio breoganii]PML12776.1 hypothetical protein BCT84_02505 [Vibrio breoganii]
MKSSSVRVGSTVPTIALRRTDGAPSVNNAGGKQKRSHEENIDTYEYELVRNAASTVVVDESIDTERVQYYRDMLVSGQLDVDLNELANAILGKHDK